MSVKFSPNLNSSGQIAFKGGNDNSSYAKSGTIGLIGGAAIGAGASYLSRRNTTIAGTKDTISGKILSLEKGPIAAYVATLSGEAKTKAEVAVKNAVGFIKDATLPYKKAVVEAYGNMQNTLTAKQASYKKTIQHALETNPQYKKAREEYDAVILKAKDPLSVAVIQAKEKAHNVLKEVLPKEPLSKVAKGAGIGAAVGLAAFMLAYSLREEDPKENYKKLKPIS